MEPCLWVAVSGCALGILLAAPDDHEPSERLQARYATQIWLARIARVDRGTLAGTGVSAAYAVLPESTPRGWTARSASRSPREPGSAGTRHPGPGPHGLAAYGKPPPPPAINR